jgi:hypothetical protein
MKLTTAETKRYAELTAKMAAPEPKAASVPPKKKATTKRKVAKSVAKKKGPAK